MASQEVPLQTESGEHYRPVVLSDYGADVPAISPGHRELRRQFPDRVK